MELTPMHKRVIALDVHQAKITACAVFEHDDGRVDGGRFPDICVTIRTRPKVPGLQPCDAAMMRVSHVGPKGSFRPGVPDVLSNPGRLAQQAWLRRACGRSNNEGRLA